MGTSPDSSSALFVVSTVVSCDPAFVDAVQSLTVRAATLAGCDAPDAGRLGECIQGLFRMLIDHNVTFATDVTLLFESAVTGVHVELVATAPAIAALSRTPHLASLRALVHTLDCVGSGGDTVTCRASLRRAG